MPPSPSATSRHCYRRHRSTLLSFLKHVRNLPIAIAHKSDISGDDIGGGDIPTTTSNEQIVVGNPSADLDSIISAIIYSYFSSFAPCVISSKAWGNCHSENVDNNINNHHNKNHQRQSQDKKTTFIPLVNLPDVSDGKELRRLRPEFGLALFLATSLPASGSGHSRRRRRQRQLVEEKEKEKEDGNVEKKEQDKDRDHLIVELLDRHILTSGCLLGRRRTTSTSIGNSKRSSRGQGENGITGFGGGGGGGDDYDNGLIVDSTLVDWNELPHKRIGRPGRGSLDGLDGVLDLRVMGCIDHHIDEGFVPAEVEPRIIGVGPGSCTSLIVRELMARGLWRHRDPSSKPWDTKAAGGYPNPPTPGEYIREGEGGWEAVSDDSHRVEIGEEIEGEAQAAKLALAAILIDTTNLTAEGKVTDVDRTAVSFLEEKIRRYEDSLNLPTNDRWDREVFFEEIQRTKQNSLDLLTIDEILGRDYKEWIEYTCQKGKKIRLGVASIVKPISWLMDRASKEQEDKHGQDRNQRLFDPFFAKLLKFSRFRNLGVVTVMTAFTDESDRSFRRELLIWAIDDSCIQPITEFSKKARQELILEEYNTGEFTGNGEEKQEEDLPGNWWIWRQKDVTKNRKQVAPLLRAAIGEQKDWKL